METMPVAEHVTDRAEARLGTVVRGKWRLERIVGVGGMATVYAATHRNKSRVAIKVLHPELAIDAEVTARFLREGYVANAVDHPGTVKVLDDDLTEDGAPFLVMELLDGETLDARSTRKGQLDPQEVLAIANQVLSVLGAAHERGVVHRDLKPENLFLTRAGELKILDFGIARLRELTPDGSSTRAGSLLGTPAFMAPEQARGRWEEVDACTDIWAVGATIFTLLTGRYVHEAETVQEQLIKSATCKAPALVDVMPQMPVATAALVDRALAFDKAERFPDAKSMQLALLSALGLSEHDSPLSLPTPSSPGLNEAQTLVAPPGLESIITGRQDVPSYNTARPVTAGVSASSAEQPGTRRWPLLAAVVALLAFGLGGLFWLRQPAPVTGEGPEVKLAAPPKTQVFPTPPPSTATSRAVEPEVAPAPPAPPLPAPQTAHAKAPPRKPALPRAPAPVTSAAKPATPENKATLVPPKTPQTNPFERRL